LVGRHPFDRLYSGWNDKSRTFRFPNGSFDFATAAKTTTFLWGETNLTKTQQDSILKNNIIEYDKAYNPKELGIVENNFHLFENNDYRRRFSWNAFADLIANSVLGQENFHNHHWKSQFYHCRPCNIDYDITTQQENARLETEWILDYLHLEGITHFGKSYSTHKDPADAYYDLGKETILKLYRHYWLDFLFFDYDLSSIAPFLDLSQL